MRLVDFSIGARANAAFVALIGLIAVVGAVAWMSLTGLNRQVEVLGGDTLVGTRALGKMQSYQARARNFLIGDILSSRDSATLEKARVRLIDYREKVAKEAAIYEAIIQTPDQRALFDSVKTAMTTYRQSGDQLVELMVQGQHAAAADLAFGDSRTRFAALMDAIDMSIAAEDDAADKGVRSAASSYREAKWLLAGALLIALATGGAAMMMIATTVASPSRRLADIMGRLARGDHAALVVGTERGDEIGLMAKAVNVFKDNMLETGRLREAQEATKRQTEMDRRQAMTTLADEFESGVGGIVDRVTLAAGQLQATAQAMSEIARGTSGQAAAAASASEQTSHNVQTVAAATEELSASIQEISRQVSQSGAMISQAADQARMTREKVSSLTEAAHKIGNVIKIIAEIASQTNLLALNATIEAARAGELGKGFAVVAAEVKALANQTSKATEEIAAQVKTIQDATAASAESIMGVTKVIGEVDQTSAAIATAVEEQNAATQEISRSVQQAAAGSGEVSSTIAMVNQAADRTGVSASEVLSAARDLSDNGAALRTQVDTFLRRVRAD